MAMIGQGARLTAKSVYNGYVVKELMNKARRHLLHGGRTAEQT